MRTLVAGGLTLEPQVAAHAEEMFAVLGDPAIYEFENEPPRSLPWLRERFARLESRRSADGREQWLNWIVRLTGAEAIGYVQATVRANGEAAIAYEFASAHWGRGHARAAVTAMMAELAREHGARSFAAVLKRTNHRSQRFLERLGFVAASEAVHRSRDIAHDELLMLRARGDAAPPR